MSAPPSTHDAAPPTEEAAKLGSFELNLDTLELTRSDELSRMLGVVPGKAPGAADHEFVHPNDRHIIRQVVTDAADGLGDGYATYGIVNASGEMRWVHTQVSRLSDVSANLVVGTVLDITDHYEAQLVLPVVSSENDRHLP